MTPLNRRVFLTRLLGLATLPFAARALGKPTAPTSTLSNGVVAGSANWVPQRAYEVQGIGIKVPSNRVWWEDRADIARNGYWPGHNAYWVYHGDWDHTLKVEPGCSNPAYILADLYERTGAQPDWVVWRRGQLFNGAGPFEVRSLLDWQMLYDWGRWADEVVPETERGVISHAVDGKLVRSSGGAGSRLTCNAYMRSHEDYVALREDLRMRCLQWQSCDPRYQRSFPGIPYPGADRTALGVYV